MRKGTNIKKSGGKKAINRDELRGRELLRVCETAAILGESRANIYLRIERGEIKAIRFGKTLRVHGPSLFGMIDQLVKGDHPAEAA